MEWIGVTQELSQLLTHAPSGRPRVLTQAINRSLAVSLQAARNLRLLGFLTTGTTLLLSLSLARGLLELGDLNADHIGRLPAIFLQVSYTLGIFASLGILRKKFPWPL